MKKNYKTMKTKCHILMVMVLALLVGMVALSSCEHYQEKQLRDTVNDFSTAYFNWQYHKAARFCAPGSERWLAYMASQVTQRDVDTLRALPEGASVRINSMRFYKGDSVAVADVEVCDFLEMDTIGKTGRWVEKARYLISARLVRGVWKVWLSAPLRAEKD